MIHNLLLPALLYTAPVAQADGFVVVIHPEVPVAELNRTEVREIFSRQRRAWNEDLAVEVVLPASGSSAMEWLSEEILDVRPAVFRRYLVEKAYRSGYRPPVEADDDTDARARVASRPGSVTVLPPAMMDEGTKALTVTD